MDQKAQHILDEVREGRALTPEECVYFLNFNDAAPETWALRALAATRMRERTDNAGVIFAQIGVECSPCSADCEFCSFGSSHTSLGTMRLSDDEIVQKTHDFCKDKDLFGLWLMTMDEYDLDYYLHVIRLVREHAPKETNLYSNVGDSSFEAFCKMKEAGIDGVYHICRLGEGKHTKIKPETRFETMSNAAKAGLTLLDAVEPIGPEHSAEELVQNIFASKKRKPIQTGAMKRIAVPGTPFEGKGEITHTRLSKIVAVQCLAMIELETLPWIGIHEPCEAGYYSGANLITAETGVNPRDTAKDTSQSRGLDMDACRRALYEAGFTSLCRGDGTHVTLDMDYIESCL